MSMRILRSMFVRVFLFSIAFLVASDIVARGPQDMTKAFPGGEILGRRASRDLGQFPSSGLEIEGVLSWNTFLGGTDEDFVYGIAVDSCGNLYVTGYSGATWGSPVQPFAGGNGDAFVAKLNASGVLQWNTFLGSSASDNGSSIALDTSGNVYVTGSSYATWGSPVRPFGGGTEDAFIAKLNGNGVLQWNTFLGGASEDTGNGGIAVSPSGNIYVLGESGETWGTPIRPFSGSRDAFAAKLDGTGTLQWNTFLGGDGSGNVNSYGIALDTDASVYLTGSSPMTWGSPVRPFTGLVAAFVAKLDESGVLLWNTFLGGVRFAYGRGIAVDSTGHAYVTGDCSVPWGSPVRAFAGNYDAFGAKLDGSGVLLWHTFLGSSNYEGGHGIALDTSGNVYMTGYCGGSWGDSPVRPYAGGGGDAFAAKLNNDGALQWNTFLGGAGYELGEGITVDKSENVYITGNSNVSWGSPVHPHAGDNDGFVAKLSPISPRKVDFNGDGKEDILWRHNGTGENAVWYLGGYTATGVSSGDSTLQDFAGGLRAMDMKQNHAPKAYRDIAEVGGFLGKPVETMYFDLQEALAFNAKQGSGDIYLIQAQMAASGGPQYLTPAVGPRKQTQNVLSYAYLPSVTDVQWTIVGTGDFNGDGQIDILWRNSVTGQNAVWFMNGVAGTGYTYLPPVIDLNWKIVGTGDFNGDGRIDILWRNSSTGQNAVWFMNGVTYVSYAYLPGVTDLNWQIVGTGDFNSDGQIDILWRNYLTGQNAAWGMNGTMETSNAYLPAITDTNWRIMGTGDFNGDGKVDIIWRNSLNGQNAIWYMNGITNMGYDYLPPVTDSLWRIANR